MSAETDGPAPANSGPLPPDGTRSARTMIVRSIPSRPHRETREGSKMDANILKGKWLQLKGNIRGKWGQLTDDDVDRVGGSVERLIGVLQERYGYQKQEAEHEVDAF